jgi:16S rRNA (cytosine1402-N4)-methyltransferase
MNYHIPVLLDEVINVLDPKVGQVFLDATLGHGGHTIELLKKGAIVYGLDTDNENQCIAIERIKNLGLSNNFHPIIGNFSDIYSIWKKNIKTPLDGLIIDLGLSVNQQSGIGRGFSFNDTESLDMRLNPNTQTLTAEEIINTWDKNQLFELFTKYAQEKLAKPLVFEIIKARQRKPIKNGKYLSEIIENYFQKKHYQTFKNPATKIFLALRIAVNNEFDSIKTVLESIQKIVKLNGNIAVISFHSGEDRIVKQFISKNKFQSKKYSPSFSEIKRNPLSRSAILRFFKI